MGFAGNRGNQMGNTKCTGNVTGNKGVRRGDNGAEMPEFQVTVHQGSGIIQHDGLDVLLHKLGVPGIQLCTRMAGQWCQLKIQKRMNIQCAGFVIGVELGIFCRLNYRDGKSHYLEDLPRFYHYAFRTAERYAELRPLVPILERLSPRDLQIGYTF